MATKANRRAKGDGSLYQRADGMWLATVELPMGGDGKRRRKTVSGKRKGDVQTKLRDLRKALGEHGDLPTSSMRTDAWLTYWLEHIAVPRLRPNSREQYRSDVRLHIAPEVGRIRLDHLTPRHVRDMGRAIVAKQIVVKKATGTDAALTRPMSSTTALRCHRVLSKALKDAVREGHLTRNVAEYVDNPARAVASRGALSADEAMALLRSVADDHFAASRWAAALMTGARQGELLGLTWERVDLEAGLIDLAWQLQRLNYAHGCAKGEDGNPTCGRKAGWCFQRKLEASAGYEHQVLRGGLCLVRPKTATGHRLVPLAPPLLNALRIHREASEATDNPFDLVWTTSSGNPIDAPRDSEAWRAALAKVGLPAVELHGARHTTATLLMELGVDAHVIAAMLGHSDIATTRMYQHVDQRLAQEAASRLGGLLTLAP